MDLSLVIHCATPAFGHNPTATAREIRTILNRADLDALALCIGDAMTSGKPVMFNLRDRHDKVCGLVEITP